jgi:hypothetical protein
MSRHEALVRSDVSEDRNASITMVTRIGEIGMLAVTTIRSTLETRGITFQETAFFIVTAMKSSDLTSNT